MDERRRMDFEMALGQSFADAISPPVPFADASAHDCFEAVRHALGAEPTPEALASLSDGEIARLAAGVGAYFECEPPAVGQIRQAVASTLVRWPASAA